MPVSVPAIVIYGPPASGKSTFAALLRERLGWPLISKDPIKEQLFDALGWRDRQWSRSLSLASYALMFSWARELTAARAPFILEGNFRTGAHDNSFRSLGQAGVRWIQVFCTADREVLVNRFEQRAASSSRHPGHVDLQSFEEIKAELLRGPLQLAGVEGPVIEFDTTQSDSLRREQVIEQIRGAIEMCAYPAIGHNGP